MRIIIFLLIVLPLLSYGSGKDTTGNRLRVVPTVDLSRYVGTWYEIARLPNGFQKDCAGNVTATYSLLDDGEMKVVNRCVKENGDTTAAEGRAKRAGDDEPTSKLKVRFAPAVLSFLPFVWGDYWIIDLAPNYSYAVVGEPNREYLWVLARTPSIEEKTFQEILQRITQQGYDLSKLIRTKQSQ